MQVTYFLLPFLSFNTRSFACPSGIFAINSGMFCLHDTGLKIYQWVKHFKKETLEFIVMIRVHCTLKKLLLCNQLILLLPPLIYSEI